MPQIPIPRKPELRPSGENSVRLSGAPDLNWNVDHGLERLGDSIQRATHNLGNAMRQYAEESAEAENTLATVEAQNIQLDGEAKLDERISANPGAYEQYGEWAREIDSETAEKLKPVLNRMTKRYREQFEERLAGRRQQAIAERIRLGNLARSRAQKEKFDQDFTTAASRGDLETVEFMISRERGRLFGDEEAELYRKNAGRLSDEYAARSMVDSGALDAVERLSARNEDGSWKEFTNMGQQYRSSMIRYARGVSAERQTRARTDFVTGLLAGKVPTEQEINAREDLSPETKNDFIKMTRAYLANDAATQLSADLLAGKQVSEQEIMDRTDLELKTKNKLVSMIRSAEGRSESAREANAARQRQEYAKKQQDARDRTSLEIMDLAWSPDPAGRKEQYDAMYGKICAGFADNPGYIITLRKQLDESLKAVEQPDSSYKNSMQYQYAMTKLDSMRDQLYSKNDERGFLWIRYDADEQKVKDQNFAMFKVRLDEFIRQNPKATQAEIDAFIDSTRKTINETRVSEVLDKLIGKNSGFRERPDQSDGADFSDQPDGADRGETDGTDEKKGIFDSRNGSWVFGPYGNTFDMVKGSVKRKMEERRRSKAKRASGMLDIAEIQEAGRNKDGRIVLIMNDGTRRFRDEYR